MQRHWHFSSRITVGFILKSMKLAAWKINYTGEAPGPRLKKATLFLCLFYSCYLAAWHPWVLPRSYTGLFCFFTSGSATQSLLLLIGVCLVLSAGWIMPQKWKKPGGQGPFLLTSWGPVPRVTLMCMLKILLWVPGWKVGVSPALFLGCGTKALPAPWVLKWRCQHQWAKACFSFGVLWFSHLSGLYTDLPRSQHWRSSLAGRKIWKAVPQTLLEHAWIPWSPLVVVYENKIWGQSDLGSDLSFTPSWQCYWMSLSVGLICKW